MKIKFTAPGIEPERPLVVFVPGTLTGKTDNYAGGRLRSVEVLTGGEKVWLPPSALHDDDKELLSQEDLERALCAAQGG